MPIKDKCFSNCRLFEPDECNPPRCKYVSGPTLKYCRLSHKYKMKKPDCNITRRIKKKDMKTHAQKTIGRLIKRSGKFLQTICSDSGVCTAFGRNTDEITQYFKGFSDFKYAKSPIKKIGDPSNNGFVKEIEYEREGYKSHAILKSSARRGSDNLVYEYLVGIKYINRIMKSFPCFVQTYGLFYYDSQPTWQIMKGTGPIHSSLLEKLEIQETINYAKACLESKSVAILIQHIKNAKSLDSFISNAGGYSDFMKFDAIYVLFIIYHALASLSTKFTHYDLHGGNVLIYEPVKGKHIEYHYHNSNGTITSFCSPYIPKIIDYGRSFFDNGNLNARKIYNKLCSTKECYNCGETSGFAWLDPDPTFFISASKKNESHDLRLLNIVNDRLQELYDTEPDYPTEKTYEGLSYVAKKVVYGVGITEEENKEYGTKEHTAKGNRKIFNVTDAYIAFKTEIEKPVLMAENKSHYSNVLNKLGDLHIYHDGRPMKYEPVM